MKFKNQVMRFNKIRGQSKNRQKKALARVEDLLCYLIVSNDHFHYNSRVAVISLLGGADDQFSFSFSLYSFLFFFFLFFKGLIFFSFVNYNPLSFDFLKNKRPK